MESDLKLLIKEFYEYFKQKFNLQPGIKIAIRYDEENAKDPLGLTAYYDPQENKIVLFCYGRHPKDITRSLAHELVHALQRQNGRFEGENLGDSTQDNPDMLEIEGECYRDSNLIFRDWTEKKKLNGSN